MLNPQVHRSLRGATKLEVPSDSWARPLLVAGLFALAATLGCAKLPSAPDLMPLDGSSGSSGERDDGGVTGEVGGASGNGGTAGNGGASGSGGTAGKGGAAGHGGTLGTGGIGGAGGTQPPMPIDPPLQTRTVHVACGSNLTETFETLPWELSVDPTPIEAGGEFSASFTGVAVFSESFLDIAQSPIFGSGIREVNLQDFDATIIVHTGANGEDVVLTNQPVEPQCGYEDPPGTRASCDPANDLPGIPGARGNTDCQPQRDSNPCGRFIALPTSDDCEPQGTCWDVGREAAAGACSISDFCKPEAKIQCEANGFCVTGPLELPLTSAVQSFVAGNSQETVRFGWHQPFPFYETPESVFVAPPGPIGLRFTIGILGLAVDCVASDSELIGPPELSDLISFPIPDAGCTDGTSICPTGFEITGDGRCRFETTSNPIKVQDPSGNGACASPSAAPVQAFLPVQDESVLSSPSLVVGALVRAAQVVPSMCKDEPVIFATVAYLDAQSGGENADPLLNRSPEDTVSASSPSIRSTLVDFDIFGGNPLVQWSASPDVCCERTFETTFTATVAPCEGWGSPR